MKHDKNPRVTIRLPKKLRERFEALAKKDSRNLSDYMRNVLRAHASTAEQKSA